MLNAINPAAYHFREEDFNRIVASMRQLLFGVKAKEYNKRILVHEYFVHGKKSYDTMLWIKVLREIDREDGTTNLDSLVDLIAYSMFALDRYQKEGQRRITHEDAS